MQVLPYFGSIVSEIFPRRSSEKVSKFISFIYNSKVPNSSSMKEI